MIKFLKIKNLKLFNNKVGMSLAELLVSVFIFSILSSALLAVVVVGQRSWITNEVKIGMRQELRKSMETMIYDLRQAGNSSIADVPADDSWYATITFQIPDTVTGGLLVWDSNAIQYVLGGADGNQLLKIQGGTTKLVSQNIQLLQFRRLSSDANTLEVNLTAQDIISLTGTVLDIDLNFKIELRN